MVVIRAFCSFLKFAIPVSGTPSLETRPEFRGPQQNGGVAHRHRRRRIRPEEPFSLLSCHVPAPRAECCCCCCCCVRRLPRGRRHDQCSHPSPAIVIEGFTSDVWPRARTRGGRGCRSHELSKSHHLSALPLCATILVSTPPPWRVSSGPCGRTASRISRELCIPGPLTLRMIERVWSSMNSTRTWVTPPREPRENSHQISLIVRFTK